MGEVKWEMVLQSMVESVINGMPELFYVGNRVSSSVKLQTKA